MNLLRAAGLDTVFALGVERGIPPNVPLEIMVRERVGHQQSNLCKRHLATRDTVPYGSLCRISDGVYVVSPALCLLQIAGIATQLIGGEVDGKFAVVLVAKVACELCGTYSQSTKQGGMVKREPLLTLGELAVMALSVPGTHGSGLVLKAIPFVVENTRSPKETDVALLLILPVSLGGFGLPRPESNYSIDVMGIQFGFFASWPACTVDFFWAHARLVVEYDSWDYHDERGSEKEQKDEARANALRELGYTVVTIKRNDLYSASLFRAKAQEIADALSVNLPPATTEFSSANETLRMMLLRHDRWV